MKTQLNRYIATLGIPFVALASSLQAAYAQSNEWKPISSIHNLTSNHGLNSIQYPRFVEDITGDGIADIVAFGRTGITTSIGNGDGSFQATRVVSSNDMVESAGWNSHNHVRLVKDVNGDSKADIIAFGHAAVFTALSKGDGTFASKKVALGGFVYGHGWRTQKHVRVVSDVNGDGRADIVAFGDSQVFTALAKSDGTFNNATVALNDFVYSRGWRVERHPRLVEDVNGDGNADIVAFGHGAIYTALSQGNGKFNQKFQAVGNDMTYGSGWRTEKHIRLLGDINGDGRSDIIALGDNHVFTALARTNGTFNGKTLAINGGMSYGHQWRVSNHVRVLGDINGDGYQDIVGFGDARIYRNIANGRGQFSNIGALSDASGDTYLAAPSYLVSDNQSHFAIMQGDGNFVVYKGSSPGDNRGYVWGTGTNGYTSHASMSSGNFAIYRGANPQSASGVPSWSSHTSNFKTSSSLRLDNSGKLWLDATGYDIDITQCNSSNHCGLSGQAKSNLLARQSHCKNSMLPGQSIGQDYNRYKQCLIDGGYRPSMWSVAAYTAGNAGYIELAQQHCLGAAKELEIFLNAIVNMGDGSTSSLLKNMALDTIVKLIYPDKYEEYSNSSEFTYSISAAAKNLYQGCINDRSLPGLKLKPM